MWNTDIAVHLLRGILRGEETQVTPWKTLHILQAADVIDNAYLGAFPRTTMSLVAQTNCTNYSWTTDITILNTPVHTLTPY
jgi:hypothetical protein